MCGRYSLEATPQALVEAFALAEAIAIEPRYNIAPTQPIAVIRTLADDGARRAGFVRWGLTPPWWSRPRPIINARGETLDRKFQRAFHRRRCLVPATGFYEWQKLGAAKQPFHVRRADGRLFAFAGIWERHRDDDGQPLDAAAVVTTRPNGLMAPLHDRMPVILGPGGWERWLDPAADVAGLTDLLAPVADDLLSAYPVGPRVNRTANDDPACAAPLVRPAGHFDEQLFQKGDPAP